jgi:hypothetical protein
VVFVPRAMVSGGGEPVERGAGGGATTVQAYAISAEGEIRPLQAAVSTHEFIKLRVEFGSDEASRATRSIEIAISGEAPIVVSLIEGSERIRTVPGAIPLSGLKSGGHRVRVRGLDASSKTTFETWFDLLVAGP